MCGRRVPQQELWDKGRERANARVERTKGRREEGRDTGRTCRTSLGQGRRVALTPTAPVTWRLTSVSVSRTWLIFSNIFMGYSITIQVC